MKRNIFTLLLIILSFSLGITKGFADVHYIVVASDRHGNTTDMETDSPIYTAMNCMNTIPVEYVCLDGDMVGQGGGDAPNYNTSIILSEVNTVFPYLTNSNVSIIYADHDGGYTDGAGIMKCTDTDNSDNNGSGDSQLVYTGTNKSGDVEYYIYGVSFASMITGESADNGPTRFKNWVKGIDPSIPIIVVCHVPLHYCRGDNQGAVEWSKALNYAATGGETTTEGATIKRNVIFLHGHNHTSEGGSNPSEYYVHAGKTMKIYDSNTSHYIYYTYTTAGYLKHRKAATLIKIEGKEVTVTKYVNGEIPSSNAYASKPYKTNKQFISSSDLVTGTPNTIQREIPDVTLANNGSTNYESIINNTDYLNKIYDVTLSGRTLYKDEHWNTLCLPFNVDLTDTSSPLYGATVKLLTSDSYFETETGALVLDFVDATVNDINNTPKGYMFAGKPYIVKWASGSHVTDPVFRGVTIKNIQAPISSEDGYLTFTGIYDPKSFAEDDRSVLYLGSYDRLYWPGAGVNIGAFRAYFQLNNGLTVNPNIQDGNNPNLTNGQQSIRSFDLNFNDNESTGIIEIVNDEKVETGWYTLDGRKLMERPAQKGMYIMNGKKIVIQ